MQPNTQHVTCLDKIKLTMVVIVFDIMTFLTVISTVVPTVVSTAVPTVVSTIISTVVSTVVFTVLSRY